MHAHLLFLLATALRKSANVNSGHARHHVLDVYSNGACPLGLSRRAFCDVLGVAMLSANSAMAKDVDARKMVAERQQRVFVAGSTGRTGRLVVNALRELDIDVVAGVRRSVALGTLSGLPTIEGDLVTESTALRLSTELLARNVSDIICTIGFKPSIAGGDGVQSAYDVDYMATLNLIRTAEAVNLTGRFVLVSSLGVDATNTSTSARMLDSVLGNVLQQKRAVEAVLRSSRLDWTIVRPGLLDVPQVQGGILLGPAGRWVGNDADWVEEFGSTQELQCSSPFLASSGLVCGATRGQVAQVCVTAIRDKAFSRRVVEVVTHPAVPRDTVRWIQDV